MSPKTKYVGTGVIRYDPTSASEPPEGKLVVIGSPNKDEDEVEHELMKLEKQRTRKKRMQEAGITEEKSPAQPPGAQTGKRYLVDPTTGVITPVEDGEGEYTYKDALLMSASLKGSHGDYGAAIELIKAAQELASKPAGAGDERSAPPQPKKGFYVDNDGIIHHDAENGELSLSEARAISMSRQQASKPNTGEVLTPEKLELMRRDLRDETVRMIAEGIKVTNPPGNQEPAFQIGDGGKVTLNPNAKLTLTDYLLYQMVNRQENPLYKDREGNVMALPQYLEIGKFNREEERKDKRSEALTGLIESGKKELPGLVSGLKNIMTSTETQSAMEKGGWVGKQGELTAGTKTGLCPSCGEKVPYTSIPSVVTCSKCGSLCFFGAPEQLKMIKEQLGGGEKSPASLESSNAGTSKAP